MRASDYHLSEKTKTRSFFFLSDVTGATESFLNSKFYLNTISQQFLLYSSVSPRSREVIFHVSRHGGAPRNLRVCGLLVYFCRVPVLLAPCDAHTQRNTVLRNVNCSNDFYTQPTHPRHHSISGAQDEWCWVSLPWDVQKERLVDAINLTWMGEKLCLLILINCVVGDCSIKNYAVKIFRS